MMNIEDRIVAIEERNKRVEGDKAWEVSWARRLWIAALTYIFAALYFVMIESSHPWLNALIPTVGFIFSTLTLPLLKKMWLNKKYGRRT